jgi:hypothetical protein
VARGSFGALDCMKSPDTRLMEGFLSFLAPTFVSFRGKVFSNIPLQDLRRSYKRRTPRTVDENTDNHEHFDLFFPDRTEEGVRKNYALANAVRLVWEERLRAQFPRRRFRLFVSNEYHNGLIWSAGVTSTHESVHTVLRLWSLPADDGFDETYHPDLSGPDWVLWPEYRRGKLVKLSTVVKIIRSRKAHPAKKRYLRERFAGLQEHMRAPRHAI